MNKEQRAKYKAIEKAMSDLRFADYSINDSVYCALVKERAQLEYPKSKRINRILTKCPE